MLLFFPTAAALDFLVTKNSPEVDKTAYIPNFIRIVSLVWAVERCTARLTDIIPQNRIYLQNNLTSITHDFLHRPSTKVQIYYPTKIHYNCINITYNKRDSRWTLTVFYYFEVVNPISCEANTITTYDWVIQIRMLISVHATSDCKLIEGRKMTSSTTVVFVTL